MAFATGSPRQQPGLQRAATAFLPSRLGRGLGDEGDEEERQPLLVRRMSAPCTTSKAVRNRATLDRQLSRRVSWMVSVETAHDDEEHEDEVCKEEASKAGDAKEAKADVSEAVKPPDAGQVVLPQPYSEMPDYGPEPGLLRMPTDSSVPVLILSGCILVTGTTLVLVAQPLLQQKWSSNWSFLLWSRGVMCVVCSVLLLLVNAFPYINPGYQKKFESLAGENGVIVLRFRQAVCPGGRWCRTCEAPKPLRVHHCSCCNRCVLGMDHHCPILRNCVGAQNHRFWMVLLTFLGLTSLHVELVLATTFISHWPGIWNLRSAAAAAGLDFATASWALLFLLAIALLYILLCLQKFYVFHLNLIFQNYTTIENLEREEGARSRFHRGTRKNCDSFWAGDRMNVEENARLFKASTPKWEIGSL